jgi:hypothetical protein
MCVPSVIYMFWTGNNEMSEARKNCLKTFVQNCGCNTVLVTSDNLKDYIIPEYPLHPAFQYLSYTHKADYLRCYFMHFYGGGYSDIKATEFDWSPYFNILNNKTVIGVGYREVPGGVATTAKNYNDIKDKHHDMIGNGSYIFRANTDFTKEWYDTMISVMDHYADNLRQNPAQHPQDYFDRPSDNYFFRKLKINKSKYPLLWTELLGGIFHPLVYKYRNQIDKSLPPINTTTDYR